MKTIRHRIHDGLAYKLDAQISHHLCGTTLQLFTRWPGANHPEDYRLLTLTLPAEDLARLGKLLEGMKP